MIEQPKESRFAKPIIYSLGCLTGICIATTLLVFAYLITNQSQEFDNIPIQNSKTPESFTITELSFEEAISSLIS